MKEQNYFHGSCNEYKIEDPTFLLDKLLDKEKIYLKDIIDEFKITWSSLEVTEECLIINSLGRSFYRKSMYSHIEYLKSNWDLIKTKLIDEELIEFNCGIIYIL